MVMPFSLTTSLLQGALPSTPGGGGVVVFLQHLFFAPRPAQLKVNLQLYTCVPELKQPSTLSQTAALYMKGKGLWCALSLPVLWRRCQPPYQLALARAFTLGILRVRCFRPCPSPSLQWCQTSSWDFLDDIIGTSVWISLNMFFVFPFVCRIPTIIHFCRWRKWKS